MFLQYFRLPLEREEELMCARAEQNGGPVFAYLDNPYPCGLFTRKGPEELWFRPITVLCGGNGSGKSTLLNLIARRLSLGRSAAYNTGELFDDYAAACTFTAAEDDGGEARAIPDGSRILTSDDVFEYMLAARTNNAEIAENKEVARDAWAALRYGETVPFRGMEDYEALRLQLLARRRSLTRRQFIRRTAGREIALGSNGETALHYFERTLQCDTLYLLDEPENSLSARLQLRLKAMLEEMAYRCGCQFILATHSPFLLALEGARIYDLDADPVRDRPWREVENVRETYDFFKKHADLFENGGKQ